MPHDGKALAWYSTQFLGTFMHHLAFSRLFAKYAKYADKQQKKETKKRRKKINILLDPKQVSNQTDVLRTMQYARPLQLFATAVAL